MAKMPAAAAAPMTDTTDPNAADATGATDDQADGSDDSGGTDNGPTVLLTVMDNHDGTYQLIAGDEDDDNEGSEDSGASDTSADDTGAGAGMETAGAASEPQGTTYDSPGALLKGILDLVKKSEDEAGGGAQDNFAAGFAGGSSASPAKAPAQKY